MSWSCTSDNPNCKPRKRQRCCVCDERIEAGERCTRRAGVGLDGWATVHFHPECDAYSRHHWKDDADWEEGREEMADVLEWFKGQQPEGAKS